MRWAISAVVGLIIVLGLPLVIARTQAFARRKRRARGIVTGIEAGFGMCDPARARARHSIEIRQEIGHGDEGDQGDLRDRPSRR
ncbi:hypothetical protein [Sphingomonas morindae]|uniref:Secreted protein n=1 Tax=Sphingomonas morindae TaxID=1541170 RepID=A0ABY4XDE7_9SPHN|nr:hypothetical protein [Sphingomonas morindae]USI75001.1 hypothetical protein LHA26_17705 [Sphingomonas morindae]